MRYTAAPTAGTARTPSSASLVHFCRRWRAAHGGQAGTITWNERPKCMKTSVHQPMAWVVTRTKSPGFSRPQTTQRFGKTAACALGNLTSWLSGMIGRRRRF